VAEHVILFTGPMGAGKTTAIKAVSEIDVVSTEANNSERHVVDKPTTTVALDYGEILLDGEEKVRLYGIPGQRRFDFMWAILKKRAQGMVLLVNNDAPDPIAELLAYLDDFSELYDRGGVVVGVSRSDVAAEPTLEQYADALAVAHPGKVVPVFTVDPRNSDHMRMALLVLVANIEMRAAFASDESESA
jgi:signal recognition particle receptor subunit beta